MRLPPFALARPQTVDEALGLLADERLPYAGGTELLLAMKARLLRPEALVDLKRLPELGGITREDGRLVAGATCTHAEVAGDPRVRAAVPVLAEVARRVGNARVRAQGTVGGNLCFAEPRSDLATLLVALEATVTLVSTSGRREVPVADFVLGSYTTDRRADELLTGVSVPDMAGRRGVYLKYQTMERPTLGVALVAPPGGRTATACRLVVGAVGEAPVAFDYPDPAHIDPEDVAAGVEPVPDLTGSARYKRHITAVYVRRAITAFTRVDEGDR